MPAPKGIQPTKFHPTSRRKVIATADVRIMQVQVVDSNGEIRGIVVWKCGTDVYWSETMDGLLDNARRKRAPDWLLEQMKEVPADRQFDSDGVVKSPSAAAPTKTAAPAHVPSMDSDVPKFAQA